jgi:diol dehydratase reactivase alpha subunit
MEQVAKALMDKTKVYVKIAGVEAVMASLGAITTPGVTLPMAVLDIGGGSTDAAILDSDGTIKSIHLAGAGELVTMLINKELGLDDRAIAEDIKKYPLGKVESLFSIRLENGEVVFYDRQLAPSLFGRVVILKDNEMVPIMKDISLERITGTRKSIKEKIFVTNSIRALKEVAPLNNIRNIPNVVLVGGSALDFEIPQMILKKLSNYRIVAGQGNVRRKAGPRNAVATGLVMSYTG